MRFFITLFCICLVGLVPVTNVAANGSSDSGANTRNTSNPNAAQQGAADAFLQMDNTLAQQDVEITAEDEYYLGRAVGVNILQHYKPWSQNPELTRYLNKICAALVINSPQPELYHGYHVMILDSPEINAFATPGGHIFISLGLLEAAPSEDALAAVIAHELAHIQLRHSIEIIRQMKLTEDMTAVADRAAGIASQEAALKARQLLFTSAVREIVNALVINGYSQAQEFEADSYALFLLASAGYTPSSLLDVLRSLEKVQSNKGFSKTHPAPALRISSAEKTIRKYPVRDTRSFRASRFKMWTTDSPVR